MGLKPVSVSQLNSYIKRLLQSDPILGNVSVVGEISNLKFHGSGHVYFSLKDENSTIRCFLPAGNVGRLDFQLEEGKEVNAYGYLYLYERGGSYSINIRDMEEAGEGRLMVQFRKLKDKLQREGLFDPDHKKELPVFPGKVAVVTSETGAAVRDIVKIIKSKNDLVNVLIYPVLVQGPSAPGEIAAAIDDLNANYPDIDVIITGRGGGSMEELWAFNEEIVARSIYNSHIPVISAVGHEVDFTIADFVADKRAETPTAAADMAVPDTRELRDYVEKLADDIKRNTSYILEILENKVKSMNPENTLRELRSRVVMEEMRCDNLMDSMKLSIENKLNQLNSRVEMAGEVINSSNPDIILGRGYSLVRDENGNIISNSDDIARGDTLKIRFAEGSAEAQVTSIE